MIVYFLTCGVVVVVVFAFASPCTGAKYILHPPPTTNRHTCATIVSCCGALSTNARTTPLRTNERTNEYRKCHAKKTRLSRALHHSPLPVVLPDKSPTPLLPFERLTGGHLVQGTSSLLLIACDHAFHFSLIGRFHSPFCICHFVSILHDKMREFCDLKGNDTFLHYTYYLCRNNVAFQFLKNV